MKKSMFLLLFLSFSLFSFSQKTYYNPSNKIDIIITIKESYKPVDYSKIGRDFNTMIQNELQRRENLKRYYDEIYYQTKNSVYSSTVLTLDNLVNSKILMVQGIIIEELDIYNRLLKNGMMKPSEYELNVRNIYFTYMNTNQIFLQIVQYKYNRDLELQDQTKINEHSKLYINTLNSIKDFKINNSNGIEFVLIWLIYPNRNMNYLYEFVKSSSEGDFVTYKINWENEDIINKQNILTTNIFNESWKKMVKEIIKSRSLKIESLNEKEKLKYLKSERKYLYEKLGKYYVDFNFGKGKRFIYNINSNIEFLIYSSIKENQKVGENNYGNKFYKSVDEFCGCGKYNSNIFK
jgi:hypothetical protein